MTSWTAHTPDGDPVVPQRTHPGTVLRARRRGRAATLAEVSVAFGLFLVVSAGLVGVAVQARTGEIGVRTQRALAEQVTAAAAQVAAMPFDDLLADAFTVPEACPGTAGGAAGLSCLDLAGRTWQVAWTVQPGLADAGGVDYLDVTAAVTGARGVPVTHTLRVAAPTPGYSSGTGLVRVSLDADPAQLAALAGGVRLVHADGSAVAAAAVGSDGHAVLRDSTGGCTSDDPCYLGLSSGANYARASSAADAASLNASAVAGPAAAIVTTAGHTVAVAAELVTPARAVIELEAANASGTGSPDVPGSVCVWATFNDGGADRSVPFCNSDDPARITLGDYAPSPGSALRLPVPAGAAVLISGDHPSGTCPAVDGQLVHGGAGWVPGAVCTSWTWGLPELFGPDAGPLVAVPASGATITNADAVWRARWSGAGARPAAGYDGEPTWGKPRQAPGCAATATCLSLGAAVPEALACPGEHCLSTANYLPRLTAPATGPAGTATVATPAGSTTGFSLVADDADADSPAGLTVTVAGLPPAGVGQVQLGGSPVTVGQVLSAGTAPATVPLQFVRNPGQTSTVSFTVRLDDGQGGVAVVPVGLYEHATAWQVSADDIRVPQNGSGVLAVRVTGSDGQPQAGALVAVTGAGAGVSVSAATTNSSGVASVPVTAAAAAAGDRVLTVSSGAASTTATLTVTPAAGALTVTASGAGQGGAGTVTVTAQDAAGDPFPGAVVFVSVTDAATSTLSARVYPQYSGCVTGPGGGCSMGLVVDPAAKAGPYTVHAASGTFTDTAAVSVTPVATYLTATPVTVAAGGSVAAQLRVTDGAGDPLAGVLVSATGAGGVNASPAAASDAGGYVDVSVTAGVGASTGRHVLTLSAGSGTGKLVVTVTGVAASLTAPGAVTAAAGDAVPVPVTVRDGSGGLLSGAVVTFTGPAGWRVTATATSGADGVATATVQPPRGAAGSYPVTATAAGTTTTITVTVTP